MSDYERIEQLMHGKRRMCSVVEIAKELHLDTEVVKPIMVQLAIGDARPYKPRARKTWQRKEPANGKGYTADEIATIIRMWADGCTSHQIADTLNRPRGSIYGKIKKLQDSGQIAPRSQKKGALRHAS